MDDLKLKIHVNNLQNGKNRKIIMFKLTLEYNIPTTEKTGRKPCCIREQIIGIVMASERDFDNVTCVRSCNLHVL